MPNTCFNLVASVPADLVAEMDKIAGKPGKIYACFQQTAGPFPRYCWAIPKKHRAILHGILLEKAAELRARYIEVEIPTANVPGNLLEQIAGRPCVAATRTHLRFHVPRHVADMLLTVASIAP